MITSATLACAGSSNDGNRTEEPGRTSGTSEAPKSVSVQACKLQHPIKSWDDFTSKYGFCERLGFRLQYCELQQEDEEMCSYLLAAEKVRVEIADECMTQDFDVERVPEMIRILEECVCGDRWETENICKFADCDERLACFRAAGFKWTSRSGERRAQADLPRNRPDWAKSRYDRY